MFVKVHSTDYLVKADEIEQQVVDCLKHVMNGLNPEDSLQDVQAAIGEAEQRFERAKFLFLSGDMSKEKFETERSRKDEIINNLRTDDYNAIMALSNLFWQSLVEWDRTLPNERKRLLRLITEVVFLRGSSVVAFQPTLAFLPFLQGKKGCCSCGSDGI